MDIQLWTRTNTRRVKSFHTGNDCFFLHHCVVLLVRILLEHFERVYRSEELTCHFNTKAIHS